MEPAGVLTTVALCATLLVSLLALFQLSKLPRSHTWALAVALLTTVVVAGTYYLFCSLAPSVFPPITTIASPLLVVWAMAITLNMLLSLSDYRIVDYHPVYHSIIYLPVLFMTLSVAFTAATVPSFIKLEWESGLIHVDFALLTTIIMVVGGIYTAEGMLTIFFILKGKAENIRWELILTCIFIGSWALNIPLLVRRVPGVSPTAVGILIETLIGVALAYAVMRRSPLIVPMREETAPVKASGPPQLPAFYLYVSSDSECARQAFVDNVKGGREGLWITRKPPWEARQKYGLVKTPFIWLTSAENEEEVCFDHASIARLGQAVRDFTDSARSAVILFEGLEYLTSNNGFRESLSLVQFINDRVMSKKGIMMVSINPNAFPPEDLAMLEAEAVEVVR